jgi:hypothetical protein
VINPLSFIATFEVLSPTNFGVEWCYDELLLGFFLGWHRNQVKHMLP